MAGLGVLQLVTSQNFVASAGFTLTIPATQIGSTLVVVQTLSVAINSAHFNMTNGGTALNWQQAGAVGAGSTPFSQGQIYVVPNAPTSTSSIIFTSSTGTMSGSVAFFEIGGAVCGYNPKNNYLSSSPSAATIFVGTPGPSGDPFFVVASCVVSGASAATGISVSTAGEIAGGNAWIPVYVIQDGTVAVACAVHYRLEFGKPLLKPRATYSWTTAAATVGAGLSLNFFQNPVQTYEDAMEF